MTEEHIPPRSTGNSQPVTLTTGSGLLQELVLWREGHVVKSLCKACNGRASNFGYVKQYAAWHELFVDEAKRYARHTGFNALMEPTSFEIELPYDFEPGRFIRQVIGMFHAVQETHLLAASMPELLTLVGPDPEHNRERPHPPLAINGHLYLAVADIRWAYGTSPVMAIPITIGPADTGLILPPASSGPTNDEYFMALTPFLFTLSTRPVDRAGLEITAWTELPVNGPGSRLKKSERRLAIPTLRQVDPMIRALVVDEDPWAQ